MSDEQNNRPEREPEFYDLIRRRPPPAPDKPAPDQSAPGKSAPDRAGFGQSGQRPPASTRSFPPATQIRTPKPVGPPPEDPRLRERRARENEKTRLTSIPPKNSIPAARSVPAAPPEEEYELPKRPSRKFDLDLGGELEKIPDYTLASPEASALRRGWTTFAKLMFTLVILGISVLLSIGILFAVQDVFGLNKPDKEIVVDVPQNAGLSQVAQKLEATGVIRSGALFKAYYKFSKPEGQFQYGTYTLNSDMSYDEIFSTLFQYASHKEAVTVMFPEGTTIYEMAQTLEQKGVCNAQMFLKEIGEHDFSGEYPFLKQVSPNSLRYYPLEGFLFPDTYQFYKNDDPINVAGKMLQNFQTKFTDDLQARMKELGYTLEQTITIASIVQKEAAESGDMKKVASVYSNRLKEPGKYPYLQADPTRKYADELKLQMGADVEQNILDAYNTYEGKDLPPGPICNPGLDAIRAALYPDKTDYYYFCSNLDSGEFFYARTLKEHERNLAKAGLTGQTSR